MQQLRVTKRRLIATTVAVMLALTVLGVVESADAAPYHYTNRVFGTCGFQEHETSSQVQFTTDDYAYGGDCTAVRARVRYYAGCGGCFGYVYGPWAAQYSKADASNSYLYAGGGSRVLESNVYSGWSTH